MHDSDVERLTSSRGPENEARRKSSGGFDPMAFDATRAAQSAQVRATPKTRMTEPRGSRSGVLHILTSEGKVARRKASRTIRPFSCALKLCLILACVAGVALVTGPRITQAQTTRVHALRFADGRNVLHLNTLLITTYPEEYTAQLTGAYLTRLDSRVGLRPDLVREVPTLRNGGISADGKTIVFHLRPHLRWSDGAPLTGRDVVFSTKRIIAKDTPVASSSGWDRIADVTSPRPDEVRFRLKSPYGPAVGTFFNSAAIYSLLPEHVLANTLDLRKAAFNDLPVGAGPFRYLWFKHGDQIVMEANPFYVGGRPKLDRIVYKFVSDENTLTTQLLTGEIDLAIRVPATQLARVRGASAVSLLQTPSANSNYLGFNNAKPPFDDRRVRLALRSALDRPYVLDIVYHGAGTVSDDPVSRLDPFYGSGVTTAPTDLRRAAALLDEAGWRLDAGGQRRRAGKLLATDLVNLTGSRIAATTGEIIRAQCSKIGVSIDVRTVAGTVVFAIDGVAARGNYEALYYGEGTFSEGLRSEYSCGAVPPHGFNYEHSCNKAVDRLRAAADASNDPILRARLYLQARRSVAADSPNVPMVHRNDNYFIRDNVRGFHPNGVTPFDDVRDLTAR